MSNIYNKYLIWSKNELNQIQKQRTFVLTENGNFSFTALFYNKKNIYNSVYGNFIAKDTLTFLDQNKDFAIIMQQENIYLYVRENYGI